MEKQETDKIETEAPRKAPHGMRVKVLDEAGVPKIIFMASLRKCPGLKKLMDGVHSAAKEIDALGRKVNKVLSESRVLDPENEADALRLEELTEEASGFGDVQEELQDKYEDAIVAFYEKSLAGAGYTRDEIVDLLSLLTTEQYIEIRSIVRTGCGFADFTK